jgi:hypothetical protein
MSKGNSSANSLKRLAYLLNQFVLSWSEGNLRRNNGASATVWPAPYQLAAIKGEAVLRRQFFDGFIPRLPHTPDAAQQLQLWDTLVNQSGALTDFINRIGINAALRREAVLPEHGKDDTRMLYAIRCEALSSQAERDLLVVAVDQFMLHQWRQLFPSESAAPKPRTPRTATPEALREQLTAKLRKHYKAPVEIRESFAEQPQASPSNDPANPEKPAATGVTFKILYRKGKNEPWDTLVSLTRPRVTTARAAAFAAAMKALTGV